MKEERFREYEKLYIRRIEKVQDYVEKHMDEELNIERLSEVAGFSMYHFSRVFQSVLNESLAHYVKRLRMEKAMFYLAHRTDLTITEISFMIGYQDSNVFTRAFKTTYGISPLAYRKKYSKNCKECIYLSDYNVPVKERKNRGYPVKGTIRIENMEEQRIIYVRHMGNYQSLAKKFPKLLKQLFLYAEKKKAFFAEACEVLMMYHDNPEFTESDKFRTSIGLRIRGDVPVVADDKIGVMKIAAGKYAIGHFEIVEDQFKDAWNDMYREWLLGSGYVPRNEIPFEVYLNNPLKDPDRIIKVEICVPIEPLIL